MKKERVGYSILFVLPSFILYTVFVIAGIFMIIYFSLTRWNGVSQPILIWLENYKKLITDANYWLVLKNTMIMIGLSLIIQIPVGLILAYLVYRTKKGFKFFRAAFFLPVVIAPVAIGLMFSLFLNGDYGPINTTLVRIGLESLRVQWLADTRIVLYSVIFPMLWQYFGFYFVIYLAALYAIPGEIFESASIDGASSFTIFTKIVVPNLRNVIGVTAVLCITGGLKAFDHPYIMTWGGPGLSSSYIGLYLYKTAFYNSNFGYGSTIAVTVLLIALIFTFLFKRFALK